MARTAVLVPDPKLSPEAREAAIRESVARHEAEQAKLAQLEAQAASQHQAEQAAAEAQAAAERTKAEADLRAQAAQQAQVLEEAARAQAMQKAEEAAKALALVTAAREEAKKSGQAIANAYDEHESAVLYAKFAAIIAESPTLHPQVITFTLQMLLDTMLRKARKRYGIPG